MPYLRAQVLTFFCVMSVGSIQAQSQIDDRTLQYLNSEPHKQLITVIGMLYEESLFERKNTCATGIRWEPLSFSIVQPLSFQSTAAHPDSGIWSYRFKFFGCTEPAVYNVIFQGQAGKQPRPGSLPPGMTKASPQLVSDLIKGLGVAGAAAGVQPDCKSVKILDTKITAEPSRQEINGVVNEGVWEEQWTAKACIKEFNAVFCLTPQVTGGTNWLLGKCRR